MQQLSAFGQKQQRITETQTLINKNSNVFTLSENQSVIQILQGYDPDNKIQDPSFIDQNNIMIIEVENSQLNKSQAQLFDEIEAKNQTEMLENDKSNISLTSTNQTIVIDHDDKNSPEQLGLIVKQVIEQAKPCSTIILPNTHFKIGSLLIDKPLILKGRSGTILEMTHGSIQVNFGEQEKYKEVFVFCECHIVLSDRADLITIRDEIENDSEKAINRNQFIYASNSKQNGKNENFENSPKNAKLQNDVHLRHEIKVHSPPSEKDDQYQETQQKQKIKDQSHKQTNRALESYDIENYDKLNMSCGGEPNLSQNQFVSNSEISSSIIPLFVVKNYTYVEIRDCLISSKNKQGAMDVAFVLNEKDENEQNQQYKGILSIKSCNIVGFSLGFLAGSNITFKLYQSDLKFHEYINYSILSVEVSQITDCRHGALIVINPKILKLSGSQIDKINGNGIQILFKHQNHRQIMKKQSQITSKLSSMSLTNYGQISQREIIRKLYIEDNLISNCKESGVVIKSTNSDKSRRFGSKYPFIKAILKLNKNKIIYNKYCGVSIKKLHIQHFEITNSELCQNQFANMLLDKVKGQSCSQFLLQQCKLNYGIENGLIAKDSFNFQIQECEFYKNKQSGIYIFDTGAVKQGIKRKLEIQKILMTQQKFQKNLHNNQKDLTYNFGKKSGLTSNFQKNLVFQQDSNLNLQSPIYIRDTKSSTQAKELKISTNGQILNQGLSNITDPILSPTLSNNGVTRGLPMLSMHTPRVENRTRNSNQILNFLYILRLIM